MRVSPWSRDFAPIAARARAADSAKALRDETRRLIAGSEAEAAIAVDGADDKENDKDEEEDEEEEEEEDADEECGCWHTLFLAFGEIAASASASTVASTAAAVAAAADADAVIVAAAWSVTVAAAAASFAAFAALTWRRMKLSPVSDAGLGSKLNVLARVTTAIVEADRPVASLTRVLLRDSASPAASAVAVGGAQTFALFFKTSVSGALP